jgi:glycine dehydrogenase
MLTEIGVDSLEALIAEAVPAGIRNTGGLDLPDAVTERGVIEALREIAGRNDPVTTLIGMGYHGTIVPPVIQRNILENPAWYTAYTPYQPRSPRGGSKR